MRAPPVRLDAADADLVSLAAGVTGYAVEEAFGATTALWLLRGARPPLLVTSIGQDIVFKFEVFTLALRDPDRVRADMAATETQRAAIIADLQAAGMTLPPLAAIPERPDPAIARDWPFETWRVDVLWRLEWTIAIERMPDALRDSTDTRFGAMPPGADHACLVASGLLFTGVRGGRFLVAQGTMPLDMKVTCDSSEIDAALIGKRAVEIHRYLVEPPPTA